MPVLTDKIVFITGASAGIGEAAARHFAREGARLILTARRADRLEKLARELPTECRIVELDVRKQPDVERAVSDLPAEWREIDLLVNNAGLARGLHPIHEGQLNDWEEMIDTNLKGLLYVTRAISPGMVERDRGHIINIGSVAGRTAYPKGNVYCATKFAVDALTKSMLIDLAGTSVRVSTVDPGAVNTEFSEVRFHGDKKRADSVYQGWTPLTADDVAEAIVWVASRPENVQVAELVIIPSAQANSMVIHKGQ